MSGIYIHGMEMPKDKAVAVVIHPDGTAYTAEMIAGVCTKYLADCTVVSVPPHGRLIDADALPWEKQSLLAADEDWALPCSIIENAPTVIEAEAVYGQYTDTAGNYHWCGTHSGEHTVKVEDSE